MDTVHPIQGFRARNGLSRQEFGERVGVSRVTVRRWEVGDRQIDVEFIALIVAVTGIPASQLRPDLARLFVGGAP